MSRITCRRHTRGNGQKGYTCGGWFITKEDKGWSIYYTQVKLDVTFKTKKRCIAFIETLDLINRGELTRLRNKQAEKSIAKIEKKYGECYSKLN
jgi:hypothetical protein